ncbi:MAG: hypothetical protein EBR82_38615 [Caulobacteraceae bacterium]|nr:hypothetical protein [Caulobacteraceae bacterium]
MRFKEPEVGDERIIRKFAWTPIYIEDTREWVWLERVTIRQRNYGISGWLTEGEIPNDAYLTRNWLKAIRKP